METDWIFVYNHLPTLPAADEVEQIIQSRNGKPVGWYEIEAFFANTPGVRAANAIDSMVIQQNTHYEILNAKLSGPLEVLGADQFLHDYLRIQNLGSDFGMSFGELRENIWTKTGEQFWPELQLRWDINRFIGRMFLLNSKMESIYLVS